MSKEQRNNVVDRQAAFKAYLDYAKDLVKQHDEALVKFDEQDPTGFTSDYWLIGIIQDSERTLGDFNATGFESRARIDWAIEKLNDRLRQRAWNKGQLNSQVGK